MTKKTEDKFYFGKPGQPERFLRIDPQSISRWESETRQKIDSVGPTVWIFVDPSGKEIWLPSPMRFREAVGWLTANQPKAKPNDYYKVAMSRPGQPERFGYSYRSSNILASDLDYAISEIQKDMRHMTQVMQNVIKKNPLDSGWIWATDALHNNLLDFIDRAKGVLKHKDSQVQAKAKKVVGEVRAFLDKWEKMQARSRSGKAPFSRLGQPEKFDASSLDRGSFAEASTSPMLGKLLAAKVMPEGGWRAVQSGSDTLVISFEDADLARDFGRRVATKGYNATSPVQAIGRYWNVEVKNGK